MECGKLTAKLRDAVQVCLLVEGKEIKRYKNIEIPDDIKKLEYKDFKFDVPQSSAITFKIMFEPGVLPEEFPQTRERRTRRLLALEAQPQEAAPAMDVAAEVEPQQEPNPLDEQPTEALRASAAEAFAQALEDAQAAGKPVADIAVVMADGEAIKGEIIGDEDEGRLVVITVEPEETAVMPEGTEATAEAEAQLEDSEPAIKLAHKGKRKKGAAATEDADK